MRRHEWTYIPAWPSQYLPDQSPRMSRYPAYERCQHCCVTRTVSTEHDECLGHVDTRGNTADEPGR